MTPFRLTRPLSCALLLGLGCSHAPVADSLETLYASLERKTWIDVTHPFDENSPHWKGFEPMSRRVAFDYAKDGFRAEVYCHVGQWGTHVDPPAHFHQGMRTADEIDVREMLLPLVVIDVHEKVAANADYVLTVEDIRSWEARYGRVPAGAFVAMRTDWSRRWPNAAAVANLDGKGVAHYPGWSRAALQYLIDVRDIRAIGHETTDTDPGSATSLGDYSLESYVLGKNRYQVELLASLERAPESGALIIVSWPKIERGTGFPARAFVILP